MVRHQPARPAAAGQAGAAPPQAGSLFALRLATGEPLWQVPAPPPTCPLGTARCVATRSAAITVIPGVVFSGTTDGMMRASATADGKVLWEYNTAREGQGYSSVVTQFVPKLRYAGVSDAVLHKILVDNPRRFLAFVPRA